MDRWIVSEMKAIFFRGLVYGILMHASGGGTRLDVVAQCKLGRLANAISPNGRTIRPHGDFAMNFNMEAEGR